MREYRFIERVKKKSNNISALTSREFEWFDDYSSEFTTEIRKKGMLIYKN